MSGPEVLFLTAFKDTKSINKVSRGIELKSRSTKEADLTMKPDSANEKTLELTCTAGRAGVLLGN